MQNIITIARKELVSYFTSPVAYIVMMVFLGITGWYFTSELFLSGFVTMRVVFSIIPFIFIIFIPIMSMRTFAEEKKLGTIELLLTKPVTDFDIIIGKFLAVLGLTIATVLPTIVYVVTLTFLGPVDIGPIVSAYIGLFLMAGVYISIGVFTSSLTENQIIAAILSFVIIFVLYLLNFILGYLPTTISNILQYISSSYHFNSIQRGVLDSRDLIYYISGITIFLFLTRLSLESRKW